MQNLKIQSRKHIQTFFFMLIIIWQNYVKSFNLIDLILIPKLSARVKLEIGGICQISKNAIRSHELYLLEVFGHVYYTVIIEIRLTD